MSLVGWMGFMSWNWVYLNENEWNRITDENRDAQHSGITQKIGGSLGAVPWLLPSETASQIFILRKFLRGNHRLDMLGYFSTEELLILVWDVSQRFSEKKTYLDIVSQKQISNNVCTSFAVANWRGPLGSSSWTLLEFTSVSRFLAYVIAYKKS